MLIEVQLQQCNAKPPSPLGSELFYRIYLIFIQNKFYLYIAHPDGHLEKWTSTSNIQTSVPNATIELFVACFEAWIKFIPSEDVLHLDNGALLNWFLFSFATLSFGSKQLRAFVQAYNNYIGIGSEGERFWSLAEKFTTIM